MKKNNQNIKCVVYNCEFNNNGLKHCELEEIKINCNCDSDKCKSKEMTICDNYKERK